jgi:acetate kinase
LRVLALNSGSSSLKAEVYEIDQAGFGQLPAPAPLHKLESGSSLESFLAGTGPIDAVGHRFVHGGARYRDPVVITDEVRAGLAASASMAPVHIGKELALVEEVSGITKAPQVAVFDTSFHRTLPAGACTYAVPLEWGVQRYGFHGLSYQYAARRAPALLGKPLPRLLVCHLGSGASLCAIRDGRSVDTTMGFTPLEGLVMSTRSGTVDPGLLLYMERAGGHSAEDLDRILNRESGLAGLSGGSGDMREILSARERGDARAGLAYDVYLHRLTREAGAMIAVLGGLDAIVFTAGVGENSAVVRQDLSANLGYLGLRLAPGVDTKSDAAIHAADSRVCAAVIHAREEWEIARACFSLGL